MKDDVPNDEELRMRDSDIDSKEEEEVVGLDFGVKVYSPDTNDDIDDA